MADIFISYSRKDRKIARKLAEALESRGFDVWWDFDLLSSEHYRRAIRAVIDHCKVAIVLWSGQSADSDFVLDEAAYAKAQSKLRPVRIDPVALPFGFGQLQTDDLRCWDGDPAHPALQSLVHALETALGPRTIHDKTPAPALRRKSSLATRWRVAAASAVAAGLVIAASPRPQIETNAPEAARSWPALSPRSLTQAFRGQGDCYFLRTLARADGV